MYHGCAPAMKRRTGLLLLCAALVAAVAQPRTCREAEGESGEELAAVSTTLQPGLTFMWTTPLLRVQLLEPSAVQLAQLEAAILKRYELFAQNCVTQRGQSANDRFFEEQLAAWERDDASFLEAFDNESTGLIDQLKQGWLANIRSYVSGAVGEEAASELLDGPMHDGSPGQQPEQQQQQHEVHLFVWASVHEGCSKHTPHVHDNSAVSGVFYVSVPDGSGAITFDDPRGLRPPFSRNRLEHSPTPGEMLLFPPWLVHGVESSCAAKGSARVSLSFNLLTTRAHDGGKSDWETLADSSVVHGDD